MERRKLDEPFRIFVFEKELASQRIYIKLRTFPRVYPLYELVKMLKKAGNRGRGFNPYWKEPCELCQLILKQQSVKESYKKHYVYNPLRLLDRKKTSSGATL